MLTFINSLLVICPNEHKKSRQEKIAGSNCFATGKGLISLFIFMKGNRADRNFFQIVFSLRVEEVKKNIDPANGINIIVSSQRSFVVGSIKLFFVSFTIEIIHNKIFTRPNSVQIINPMSGARSSMF